MSQRKVLPKKLTVAQQLFQFLVFYRTCRIISFLHSLTHTLSANFFSPPIFCSHIYYSLNNITITAHMFSELQKPCWYTQITKRSETLTNNRTTDWPNLLFSNWHKRHQTKTETTNIINHNLNYVYYTATIEQKSQSSMTNTTPKVSCLY